MEQVTRSLRLKQWLSLHKSCTTPTSSLLSLQTCKGLILRSVKCTSSGTEPMCVKSIDYSVQTPNDQWECVCLISTSSPKAKTSLHIMSIRHYSVGFFFSSTGEEGCGSFVQQYCETSDWHSHTHSRVHLYTPTDPLHAFERVSSSF